MTIFEKIASGEIPAKLIHEAEDFVAFHDNNPQAPVHVLIIPRKCIPRVALAEAAHADLLGRMLLVSRERRPMRMPQSTRCWSRWWWQVPASLSPASCCAPILQASLTPPSCSV